VFCCQIIFNTNYTIKIAYLITLNSQNRKFHSITAHWHKQVLQVIRIAGNYGHPRKKHIIIKLVWVCLENDTHRVHRTTSVFYKNKWFTYKYISHTNHEVENRNNY